MTQAFTRTSFTGLLQLVIENLREPPACESDALVCYLAHGRLVCLGQGEWSIIGFGGNLERIRVPRPSAFTQPLCGSADASAVGCRSELLGQGSHDCVSRFRLLSAPRSA